MLNKVELRGILEKGRKFVPEIYLVIGESVYRRMMSLSGYEIKMTPFGDPIAKTDYMLLFVFNQSFFQIKKI